jgi:hypothetical protein
MASDKLFWKKKIRKAASLRREKERRASYDVVLIVCEGSKTEPKYLRDYVRHLGLTNANVEVSAAHIGTDSLSVVKSAMEKYESAPIYDHVYCVFDRDDHGTYEAALRFMATKPLGKNATLHSCISIPCFEIWLVLHYEYTSRQFVRTGKKSRCDNVAAYLSKTPFGHYTKGMNGVFERTKNLLGDAITHSKRLRKYHQKDHADPSTEMHTLAEYLRVLKDQRRT